MRAARNGSESRDRRQGHWGSGGEGYNSATTPVTRDGTPEGWPTKEEQGLRARAPCERVISTSEERARLRLTAGRTYGPCDEYIQVNLNLNL